MQGRFMPGMWGIIIMLMAAADVVMAQQSVAEAIAEFREAPLGAVSMDRFFEPCEAANERISALFDAVRSPGWPRDKTQELVGFVGHVPIAMCSDPRLDAFLRDILASSMGGDLSERHSTTAALMGLRSRSSPENRAFLLEVAADPNAFEDIREAAARAAAPFESGEERIAVYVSLLERNALPEWYGLTEAAQLSRDYPSLFAPEVRRLGPGLEPAALELLLSGIVTQTEGAALHPGWRGTDAGRALMIEAVASFQHTIRPPAAAGMARRIVGGNR